MSADPYESSPILQNCKKRRKAAKWTGLAYLVPIGAMVPLGVIMGPAGIIIAGLLLIGVLGMRIHIETSIATTEKTERERIRKQLEEKENKARKQAQLQVVEKWLASYKEVRGLITIPSTYPCKRGEGVLYTEDDVRVQETRKVRGPGGTSNDQWTTLDTGTLYVTNQRLIFVGDNNTRNIAIKDIVSTKAYVDSFDVTSSKRSKPMGFLCNNPALMRAIVNLIQDNPNIKLVSEIQPEQEASESSTPHVTVSVSTVVSPPDENEEAENLELLEQVLVIIAQTQRASTSSIQRRLRIGYNRASHLMDMLEAKGLVGPARGEEPREILFDVNNVENVVSLLKNDDFICNDMGKTPSPKTVHSPEFIRRVEEYFEQLGDATSELGDFIREMDDKPEVAEITARIDDIDAVDGLGIFSTKNAKLGFLIFEDLLKTWKGLGKSLATAQLAELSGLVSGISQVVQTGMGLASEDWMEEAYKERARETMMAIEQKVNGAVELVLPEDQFLLPFVFSFSQEGPEWGQRFLTLLYRWASIVAKVDRYITEAESAWLAKIVNAAGISGMGAPQEGRVIADPTLSAPMRSLEKMVGLEPVKTEVEKLASLVRIQQERERQGIKTVGVSYHCVFTGNPGTGKTTVARIVAGIYKDLGVLKKGHLVETDRAGLVAEYVGQTGPKTNKVIDSALDGVLFIDEAYSLVEGSEKDYGKEAIATLLKRMEDDRARLVVILAGYSENMKRFIESNPGLQSRFNRYIDFPDYGVEDLVAIFKRFAKTSQYRLGDGTEEILRRLMEKAVTHKDEYFGNGRFARNVFEKAIERQAMRLASIAQLTKEMLQEILPEDIPEE